MKTTPTGERCLSSVYVTERQAVYEENSFLTFETRLINWTAVTKLDKYNKGNMYRSLMSNWSTVCLVLKRCYLTNECFMFCILDSDNNVKAKIIVPVCFWSLWVEGLRGTIDNQNMLTKANIVIVKDKC